MQQRRGRANVFDPSKESGTCMCLLQFHLAMNLEVMLATHGAIYCDTEMKTIKSIILQERNRVQPQIDITQYKLLLPAFGPFWGKWLPLSIWLLNRHSVTKLAIQLGYPSISGYCWIQGSIGAKSIPLYILHTPGTRIVPQRSLVTLSLQKATCLFSAFVPDETAPKSCHVKISLSIIYVWV